MPKRDWGSWPKNAYDSINKNAGGFLGIAGILTGAVGLVVTAPVALAIGGVTVAGTFCYAVVSGFPKEKIDANDYIGQKITLEQLQNLSEDLLKIGIFGIANSGKSTFIKHAILSNNIVAVTNEVSATIALLQVSPPRKVALLDGDGKNFSQQFKVVNHSQILIVFLDHNSGDTELVINNNRLERHDEYLQQLEGFLKTDKLEKIKRIHFVLNKKDLYEQISANNTLVTWFEGIVNDWSRKNFSDSVSHSFHSNNNSTDISILMNIINSIR
jgi:GTP-binding protein EngB required for normal cell division